VCYTPARENVFHFFRPGISSESNKQCWENQAKAHSSLPRTISVWVAHRLRSTFALLRG
jgi:hypothetical protein